MELYAGFGKHVYTAFATIGGNAVGIVATGETLCHNCVAKASRFVRLCDAFSVPVLTIVNTNGFVPSATDDIAGASVRLPVWLPPMPMLPPPRWLCCPARLWALSTPLWPTQT